MSIVKLGLVYDVIFFFFNDTATTEIYTLSLHDALPICDLGVNDVRVAELVAHLDKIEFEPVDECIPAPVA